MIPQRSASLTLQLAPGPLAPRDARAAVRRVMQGHAPGAVERAMLLASELVTNAVIHAATPLVLSVALDDGHLRVLVEDDDEHAPVMAAERGPHGGFGLHIVEELADSWGTSRRPGAGKVVWFEMALPRVDERDQGDARGGRELQDA
jgi:anti-sigma regulatory factor (Ser/Thr protein kinase)